MKQIRRGVFETNSSSVHSITMCMKSDYDKWVNGELYWDRWGYAFVSKDVVENELKKYRDNFLKVHPDYIQGDEEWENKFDRYLGYDKQFYTHDEYYDLIEYETFVDEFKTPSGEEVISFGYYGNEY